jgi:hypothetical protein
MNLILWRTRTSARFIAWYDAETRIEYDEW